jgi:glutamyl-tRNA synthetase
LSKFSLKFTKGNTVVNFKKLNFLQKLYAQKYVAENGKEFEGMVDEVLALARERNKIKEYVLHEVPPSPDR